MVKNSLKFNFKTLNLQIFYKVKNLKKLDHPSIYPYKRWPLRTYQVNAASVLRAVVVFGVLALVVTVRGSAQMARVRRVLVNVALGAFAAVGVRPGLDADAALFRAIVLKMWPLLRPNRVQKNRTSSKHILA